ncbi:sulfotransferase domain-containing protein [Micromonospora sp. NPDC050187]|uniref:sulfotransferase domain-containing protein n=1 Tax=Micromonospora sp. NPDC050187 TaxID=3364277 RepID=UPI0037AA222B
MDASSPDQAIIISTGRCGSTLVSDLIAEQPDTLSVQEFFVPVGSWIEDKERLSGAEYWSRLSEPNPALSALFRIGLPPPEVRYPENGRWAGNLGELPRVLATTLPKISSDPDHLYDTLAELVPGFPAQPVAQHHQMFLELLTSLTNRRRWVERSGGSSHFCLSLLKHFPAAKIVYLTRSWADTAESMRRHSYFQLLELRMNAFRRYGLDPFEIAADQPVPEEMKRYLPGQLTAQTLSERGGDIGHYLVLCAFLANEAEQAIADAGPRELLTMTYEDLVDDPLTQLSGLGRFLGFDDWAQWAHRVVGSVETRPRGQAAARPRPGPQPHRGRLVTPRTHEP